MLRSVKSLIGYNIAAQDGEIGKVVDLYFDDEKWIIRYLVVDTGSWLSGRCVLLSPAAFVPAKNNPDWSQHTVPVFLTQQEVKDAPDVLTEQPISRRKEIEMAQFYQWPYYWDTDPFDFPNTNYVPVSLQKSVKEQKAEVSHLRSFKEVAGYHTHGIDGNIGHVADFIIQDENWHIMYFVVDTKNILPGKKVLLSLQWVRSISWSGSEVKVDLPRESIKESPAYDPDAPVNRKTEEVLYDFHGRPKYWE